MNTHFLAYMILTFGIVKALEFVSSMLFSSGGLIANPTLSRMLGYGT